MQNYKIALLLMASVGLSASADYQLSEPENSALAQGHWVKIRVEDNGVYGFSHERLRELGFQHPEAVHVFGYDPTLLLDHDFVNTPSDMNLLQSVNENGQLVFYAVGNADYRHEIWPAVNPGTTVPARRVHSYSRGATYFLSDVEANDIEISAIDAPETAESMRIYSTHDALIYHEEDAYNPGEGGVWICGPGLKKTDKETHHISVSKSTGMASLTYVGLMSCLSGTTLNNFIVECTGGISTADNVKIYSKKLTDHYEYYPFFISKNVQFPADREEPFEFDITFSPNPAAGNFDKDAGLDFFALAYQRHNDLANESNMLMYFNNTDSVALASFANLTTEEPWHIWNVTNFNSIKEHRLLRNEDGTYAFLSQANANRPNALALFRTDKPQREPEIIGNVANQNLHAIAVPDLVIVAAKPMMDAAEIAANFHRELQGLDVAVVDQQQIFNEYGSGNISPESLRRFFAHLYQRDPQKLKAILLLGDGSYMNALTINDESSKVVTAQMEMYDKANQETLNSTTDAFFGSFTKKSSYSGAYFNVISAGMTVPVGRLPFSNANEVQAYYNKARRYITDRHTYPAAGNAVFSSDYATREEQSHMANGETLIKAIPTDKRALLTTTRAASNLFSTKDNFITRHVLMSTLERGAGFYAFFGHGSSSQFGGKTGDYLTHLNTVNSQNHPGRYPFIFIGSCLVGAYDHGTNLATALTANEFGGGIAVIAASRTVFQQRNENLGKYVIKSFYELTADDWLGTAWLKGANGHMKSSLDNSDILNTCAYNYIGDPAMPSFATTHSIEFDGFETLAAGGENILSGKIVGGDDFNGEILLSVYDSPRTIANVAPSLAAGKVPDATTINECEIDQELIGEYIGKVENGRFSVTFRGPRSGRPANHRIQAYAYSADDKYRALGVITAPMVDAEEPYQPEAELPTIDGFIAGNGEADNYYDGAVTLTAKIIAPAGIADANAMLNPVRLTIDGVAQTNIRRMLVPVADHTFALDYIANSLAGGRHTATLQVLDANGNIAEASVEFSIDNAPKANLSVAITDDGANFEYAFNSSAVIKDAMLIVENLAGETIKYQPFENNSTSCNVNDLKSGAYRAYVQLLGDKVAAATPKIEVIIN